MNTQEEDYNSYGDYDDYREEQRELKRDTFYALTGGQYGDYDDGIDMDDLMDGLGY